MDEYLRTLLYTLSCEVGDGVALEMIATVQGRNTVSYCAQEGGS